MNDTTPSDDEDPRSCTPSCESINLTGGVVIVPDSIEWVGECGHGCCDDYRCTRCGRVFRVEWPD